MKAIFKKLYIRIESPGLEPIKTGVANGVREGWSTAQLVEWGSPGTAAAPHKPSVVGHACSPSTWLAESEGTEVQGRSWLWTEFRTTLSYVRPGLKSK